jgi:hypothetical protein
MRRSSVPSFLLVAALAIPAPVSAQTTPAPAAAPAAGAPAATTQPAASTASSAPAPAPASTPTNARLAPGGVVTGKSSFPLHIQATLDNAVGNGLLAPGYQAQPSWSSSLNLRPTAAIPRLPGLPRMNVSASIDFSVNNWLPASSNIGVFDRQVRVGDPSLALILPAIFVEEFTGIMMSVVGSVRAPLSITSRQQNLITNAGGAAQFMWGSPETPIGSFFVQYTPSARFNFYSQPGPTMPCETPDAYAPPRPLGDPVNGLDELPLVLPRVEQLLPNGECVIAGRQNIGSLNNSFATGWSTLDGAHNVTLSLAYSLGFLRPLKSDPSLSSPFSSGQNFNENTQGSVSYTYTVPVDFPFFLTTGVFSGQPVWTADGSTLRFPFWDFITPANNFSGGFFDITVGI